MSRVVVLEEPGEVGRLGDDVDMTCWCGSLCAVRYDVLGAPYVGCASDVLHEPSDQGPTS